MVGYFRIQHILSIVLGALAGFLAAFLPDKGIVSMIVFPILGAGLGRLLCGFWANKQVDKWNEILFLRGDPEAFISVFTPVLARTAKSTLEYVDGCNKMAYAQEAMGNFDKAWEYLNGISPENLRGREMDGLITTYSNRTRVLLLRENLEEAELALQSLKDASERAMPKYKKLAYAGRHYARLYENWLCVLKREEADLDFIREEIRLSNNRIRNSELLLVLSKAYEDQEDDLMAEDLRLDAMSVGVGLWAEEKARELLSAK